jgi:2-polyprenyl-3-methyl-5-hydroxy-6-metoxy-1,4-benzoquinol methylase
MTLHEEIWARYQEVHAGHVEDYASRGPWMREYARLNVVPHFPPDARNVLEIACGNGDLLHALRRLGFYVTGTDLCPANVERTSHVYLRDVFKQPLDARFDAIVAMGIIEHLPKDELLPALRACASMLKPGGTVQFHTQNMDAAIGVHYRYLDITHELGFTHESLAQVGRVVFPHVYVAPMVYPPDTTPGWKAAVLKWASARYRNLYRWHLKLLGTPVIDTWYDKVGLVGVFATSPTR